MRFHGAGWCLSGCLGTALQIVLKGRGDSDVLRIHPLAWSSASGEWSGSAPTVDAQQLKRLFIWRRASGLTSRAEPLQGRHRDSRGFMPDDRPASIPVSRACRRLSLVTENGG